VKEAETLAFVEQINNLLRHDEVCQQLGHIPIKNPMDLFNITQDGVLLCRMINAIRPGLIPDKSIKLTVNKNNISVPGSKDAWEIAANNNAVIKAAQEMGCVVVNIGSEDILGGNQDLVLGLVWQLIRAHLMRSVNLASHPELIRLLKPNEKLDKLLNMRAEEIILRWFNYHLRRAGPDENGEVQTVSNFGTDVADCSKWVALFKQVAPIQADQYDIDEVLEASDPMERAGRLLDVAEELDCRQFTTAKDIVKCHARLNLAFTATIFNEHIGINLPTEDEIARLYAELEELKRNIKDCAEHREEVQQRVSKLIASKEQLEKELHELAATSQDRDAALAALNEELAAMILAKQAEIDRLKAILDGKDAQLAAKVSELEAALAEYRTVEDDKNGKLRFNKDKLHELQNQAEDLQNHNQQMQDILDGKGSNVDEMRAKLQTRDVEIANKATIIGQHIASSKVAFTPHAETLGNMALLPQDAESEKEQLKNQLESNLAILNAYEDLFKAKKLAFNKHQEDERKALEELNKSVSEYLGEGQSSAEDAIANMKRLLELMIAKCKKQANQIKTLDSTIKNKDKLNDLMSEKIRSIAEEQLQAKSKKKTGKK